MKGSAATRSRELANATLHRLAVALSEEVASGAAIIERAHGARRGTLHIVDDSTQRGASRETLIADALDAVFDMLDQGENTPRVRELRSLARSYDRAVKHWMVVPPTFAQLDAMFDLVVALHGMTVAVKRMRCA